MGQAGGEGGVSALSRLYMVRRAMSVQCCRWRRLYSCGETISMGPSWGWYVLSRSIACSTAARVRRRGSS